MSRDLEKAIKSLADAYKESASDIAIHYAARATLDAVAHKLRQLLAEHDAA